MDARCYSYYRFSTAKQGEEGKDSLRRQTTAAERWAREHSMTIEPLTFRDLGVSGYRGKHAKKGRLSLFLKAIEDGVVRTGDYLLVERIDRLTRQEPLDAFDLIRSIVDRGVTVVTVGDGVEYSRQSLNKEPGRIYVLLGAIQAAHVESQARSERLRGVWEHKHQEMVEGRKTAKRPPGWLTWNAAKKRYEPNEHAATVKIVWELSAEEMGTQSIARELNERGLPVFGKRRKQVSWNGDYVHKIVSSTAVTGSMQPVRLVDGKPVPMGDPIHDFYPRVVSQKIFDKVQKLKGKKVHQGGSTADTAKNMFTRRAVCAQCGHSITPHDSGRGRGYIYYMCRTRRRGGDCSNTPWRQRDLEELILRYVIHLTEIRGGDDRGDLQGRIEAVSAEITDLDRRIQTLTTRLEDPAFPDSQAKRSYARIEEMDRERVSKAREVEKLHTQQSETNADTQRRQVLRLLDLLPMLDDQNGRREIKGILGSLIERVEVYSHHAIIHLSRGGSILCETEQSAAIDPLARWQHEQQHHGKIT